MNIRKETDYSTMFAALDALMAAQPLQMELYCKIGRVVGSRAEKGAAVAASEYLQAAYPAADGFSPRNLRRMRNFYRMYGDTLELLAEAMRLNWTQNVVILEAELTKQIHSAEHLEIVLDCQEGVCYTEPIENSTGERK